MNIQRHNSGAINRCIAGPNGLLPETELSHRTDTPSARQQPVRELGGDLCDDYSAKPIHSTGCQPVGLPLRLLFRSTIVIDVWELQSMQSFGTVADFVKQRTPNTVTIVGARGSACPDSCSQLTGMPPLCPVKLRARCRSLSPNPGRCECRIGTRSSQVRPMRRDSGLRHQEPLCGERQREVLLLRVRDWHGMHVPESQRCL